jgi:hypothetical protein
LNTARTACLNEQTGTVADTDRLRARRTSRFSGLQSFIAPMPVSPVTTEPSTVVTSSDTSDPEDLITNFRIPRRHFASHVREVKGDIELQTGEKIYHFPGCRAYGSVRINLRAGEQWFLTEKQAKAAGWQKAKECPSWSFDMLIGQ